MVTMSCDKGYGAYVLPLFEFYLSVFDSIKAEQSAENESRMASSSFRSVTNQSREIE
jgi:hypothetical protein